MFGQAAAPPTHRHQQAVSCRAAPPHHALRDPKMIGEEVYPTPGAGGAWTTRDQYLRVSSEHFCVCVLPSFHPGKLGTITRLSTPNNPQRPGGLSWPFCFRCFFPSCSTHVQASVVAPFLLFCITLSLLGLTCSFCSGQPRWQRLITRSCIFRAPHSSTNRAHKPLRPYRPLVAGAAILERDGLGANLGLVLRP